LTDRSFSELIVRSRSKEDVVSEFRIQSIQDAAMRVIARKGMAAATIAEIAEEAKVAKGTIYLYFRDRDELVEKTFEKAIGQLHARVEQAMAAGSTFEEKLRGYIGAKLAFFQDHRDFFRLFLSRRMPEGNPQQQRRQKRNCQTYRNRIEWMAVELSKAMDAGEIRRMDPFRMALLLVEGSTAIVMERLTEDAPPAQEEDVKLIVDVFLNGIRSSN
jgi:AcrR family transcriptional regulator